MLLRYLSRGRFLLREAAPRHIRNEGPIASPQEAEVVSVALCLADEQPAYLRRCADPCTVFSNHLRVQRNNLRTAVGPRRESHKAERGAQVASGFSDKLKQNPPMLLFWNVAGRTETTLANCRHCYPRRCRTILGPTLLTISDHSVTTYDVIGTYLSPEFA